MTYHYWLRIFFFFSSRRRHTRYWRDWSSDVCSSEMRAKLNVLSAALTAILCLGGTAFAQETVGPAGETATPSSELTLSDEEVAKLKEGRSEERRVGKEGRSRWSPYH